MPPDLPVWRSPSTRDIAPETLSRSHGPHTIRNGSISASIWRQDTEKGPMFNATFQRSYKEGEAWRNSTSFGCNNLLLLSLMAMRAFEWIASLPKTGQCRV